MRIVNIKIIIILMVSSLLILNGFMITILPVFAEDESTLMSFDARVSRGKRAVDNDTSSNNFAPVIDTSNMSTYVIINGVNSYLILNVTVYDPDENNATSWNGTNITSVTVDLSALGGSATEDMDYNASASENSSLYNITRFEGFWQYNLSLSGMPASNYLIWFNATDNGLNDTWTYSLYNNSVKFTIMIGQENRPPDARTVGEGGVFSHNFDEDANISGNPYKFNLNDTVFIDPEIVYQTTQQVSNYPNTAADALTFTFWDGSAWISSSANFGNFSVSLSGEVASVTGKANKLTMPAGEYVTFNVTDSYGESATKNIKIIINAVNDAPMLDMADDWVYNNDNASSTDGITIDCTQNLWVDLNITANDIDSSILTFTIDN